MNAAEVLSRLAVELDHRHETLSSWADSNGDVAPEDLAAYDEARADLNEGIVDAVTHAVRILDRASSESSQHYIDTGAYLTHAEMLDAQF